MSLKLIPDVQGYSISINHPPTSEHLTINSSPEFALQLRNFANNQGIGMAEFVSDSVAYSALIDATHAGEDEILGVMDFSEEASIRLSASALLQSIPAVGPGDQNTTVVEQTGLHFSPRQVLGLAFAASGERSGDFEVYNEEYDLRIAALISSSVQLYVSRLKAEQQGWRFVIAPGENSEDFNDIVLGSELEVEYEQ